MSALIDVILPVFLVIGFGYVAAWRGLFSDSAVDGVMRFAQNFAVPCLLFTAISRIDFAADFSLPLMFSFYIGAFAGFAVGFLGGRYLFNRPIEDCISFGFVGLFSNSLLLGLPITERAYGTAALTGNYTIISIHAPMLYAFGIVLMETARSRGSGLGIALLLRVLKSIFTNPLVIGILLGFIVNFGHIPMPGPLTAAVDMMVRAALPAALFGLGGVLLRYKPEGDMKAIAFVCAVSLIVHPAITYGLGIYVFALDQANLRSAVMTASMAPGVNTYLFANMYGAGRRVAASSVLIGTALSIFTIWVWLAILP